MTCLTQRRTRLVRLNNAVHVALTAYYWSSLANDSYLGVTGHTIDHCWSLHSFALAVYHVEDILHHKGLYT